MPRMAARCPYCGRAIDVPQGHHGTVFEHPWNQRGRRVLSRCGYCAHDITIDDRTGMVFRIEEYAPDADGTTEVYR